MNTIVFTKPSVPRPNLSNFDIDILARVETVGMDVKVTEGLILSARSSRCVDAQRSALNTERSYQVSFMDFELKLAHRTHVLRMRHSDTLEAAFGAALLFSDDF